MPTRRPSWRMRRIISRVQEWLRVASMRHSRALASVISRSVATRGGGPIGRPDSVLATGSNLLVPHSSPGLWWPRLRKAATGLMIASPPGYEVVHPLRTRGRRDLAARGGLPAGPLEDGLSRYPAHARGDPSRRNDGAGTEDLDPRDIPGGGERHLRNMRPAGRFVPSRQDRKGSLDPREGLQR